MIYYVFLQGDSLMNNYFDTQRPRGRASTIHRKESKRYYKAIQQFSILPAYHGDIIASTLSCLRDFNITYTDSFSPYVCKAKLQRPSFYKELMEQYSLDDLRDIVWMKFTNKGYLGVVATSNDINFDIPPDATNYNDHIGENYKRWKYNTSGIIVHMLNMHWDERFVFVFPLPGLQQHGYSRGEIECAIGNKLINDNIPILDFYSHRY